MPNAILIADIEQQLQPLRSDTVNAGTYWLQGYVRAYHGLEPLPPTNAEAAVAAYGRGFEAGAGDLQRKTEKGTRAPKEQ